MLDRITPVILTLNEEANLERTLRSLQWAKDVVIVDSGSSDGTKAIAASFPNVRFIERRFDDHAGQWNFALFETEIRTEWALTLDADYLVPGTLVEELRRLEPPPAIGAYRAWFLYAIDGRPLRGSLYPPRLVLVRKSSGRFVQEGHTQRFASEQMIGDLATPVIHDDRKPFPRWLENQFRYMKLESEHLARQAWKDRNVADRVRSLRVLAPIAAPLYALFFQGAIFSGRRGLYYAMQRMIAESILSALMLQRDLDQGRGQGERG